MRKENEPVRTRKMSGGRLARLLMASTIALAVGLPASASAVASTAAPGVKQVTLPGSSQTSTVTLPTGDKVTLTGTGGGHFRVSASPAPGSPAVAITSVAGPDGLRSMLAVPVTAAKLIASGLVDQHLFDVRWLASHGDTGANGTLPVTLEYTGAQPGALPGATVTGTSGHTVSLTVRADHAAQFWAALNGDQRAGPMALATAAKPALAAGISRVWPTGDATTTQASPADTTLYNVTENITFTRAMVNGVSTLGVGLPNIIGVTGSDEGQTFNATGISCVTAACTTVQITFSVPTGVYMLENLSASFWADDHAQELDIAVPQVTVAGPTTINVNADKAGHIAIATPKPSQMYGGVLNAVRTDVDQVSQYSDLFAFYAGNSVWAVPTAPVTIGRYHLTNVWHLGPVPLTMTTSGPQHIALHVTYPYYNNSIMPFTRFSGTQNLNAAYVGYGTAQDFAAQDVHGKLVIIRSPDGTAWSNTRDQMTRALAAGAAGVLGIPPVDPTTGNEYLPVPPSWYGDGGPAPALPFAEVTPEDASALISLLQKGPVKLSVSDSSASSYLYNLAFTWEGQIPASQQFSVTSSQLRETDSAFQAPRPGVVVLEDAAGYLGDSYISGYLQDAFTVPNTFQQYWGPVDPSLVWWRAADNPDWPVGTVSTWDVMNTARRGAETYFDKSEVPGTPDLSQDVIQAQPGVINGAAVEDFCSFCRQGNSLYAQFSLVSGQSPRVIDGIYQAADPSDMHLYLNGGEISPGVTDGLITYQMPAAQGQYKLTYDDGDLDSTWTFSSAEPTTQALADGYGCIGALLGKTGPCAAVPMIMLRYDASADVNDAITAGGGHLLQVTSLDQATGGPSSVTSLKFWTSTDGGTTWQQARVSVGGDGSFLVAYSIPKLGATNGNLSIRAQATDKAGDTIDQTYVNDYPLIAGH